MSSPKQASGSNPVPEDDKPVPEDVNLVPEHANPVPEDNSPQPHQPESKPTHARSSESPTTENRPLMRPKTDKTDEDDGAPVPAPAQQEAVSVVEQEQLSRRTPPVHHHDRPYILDVPRLRRTLEELEPRTETGEAGGRPSGGHQDHPPGPPRRDRPAAYTQGAEIGSQGFEDAVARLRHMLAGRALQREGESVEQRITRERRDRLAMTANSLAEQIALAEVDALDREIDWTRLTWRDMTGHPHQVTSLPPAVQRVVLDYIFQDAWLPCLWQLVFTIGLFSHSVMVTLGEIFRAYDPARAATSTEESEGLTTENDSLRDEDELLKKENESLDEDNEELEVDRDALLTEKKDLKEENEKLENENRELKDEEFKIENEKQNGEVETLKEENTRLKKQNEKLTGEVEKLEGEVKTLKKVNKRLKKENEKLKEKIAQRDTSG